MNLIVTHSSQLRLYFGSKNPSLPPPKCYLYGSPQSLVDATVSKACFRVIYFYYILLYAKIILRRRIGFSTGDTKSYLYVVIVHDRLF